MVTTAGSDSGTAATPRLTASTAAPAHDSPWATASASTSAHSALVIRTSCRESAASRRCSGVGRTRPLTIAAMRPSALEAPVRTTSPRPRPRVTMVPDSSSSPASLATGTDSPVIAASSTMTLAASVRSRSPGTTSPASSLTTSPGTSSIAGSSTSLPSRHACAEGAAIRDNASTARWARTSCTTPMVVLRTTTAAMITASARSPIATTRTRAAQSSMIMGSRSWCATRPRTVGPGSSGSSLRPCSSRRRAASAEPSPAGRSTVFWTSAIRAVLVTGDLAQPGGHRGREVRATGRGRGVAGRRVHEARPFCSEVLRHGVTDQRLDEAVQAGTAGGTGDRADHEARQERSHRASPGVPRGHR